MAEDSFPTAQEKWDELPIADKTWKKWKNYFVNAPAAIERATQASGGSFGSSNDAAAFHGTGTSVPADDTAIPLSTVEKLDRYLENMATAATKERDVLNRLLANNERLSITNATTLSEIKIFLANAANSGGGSESGSAPVEGGGSA